MDRTYQTDDFELEEELFELEGSDDGFEYEPGLEGDDVAGELEFPEVEDELDEPEEFEDDDVFEDGGYAISEDEYEYEFDLTEDDDDEYFEDDDEEIFGFIKKIGRGIGSLVKKGARALRKVVGPLLKTLGPIAARIVGGAIGGPAGAKIGGTIASAILREGEIESAGETEAEFERSEIEFEAGGGNTEVFEAMMDEAEVMAETESERRVNRRFGRLARMVSRLFGHNRRLRPVIPHVVRAALALVKTFRANRKTRWAIRAIPLIIRRTLTRLARARKIDRRAIVVAMSRETAWVLANRRRAMMSLRRGRGGRRRMRSRNRRRRGRNREELVY